MKLLTRIWQSSLGKKYIMALSGVGMFLFVTGHMLGNLQLFLGPEALNRYAHFLQSNQELLWPVRLSMLALVGLHVWSALRLWQENGAARPVEYAHGKAAFGADLASRSMMVGGVIVGLFIVYHLLHYTVCVRAVSLTGKDFAHLTDATGLHDVYAMVVYGFSVWPVSLFYVVAVGALCFHLSHGASAMFQSLGLRNHTWWPAIQKGARLWAVVLFIGYILTPSAVLLGYGKDYVKQREAKDAQVGTPSLREGK